MGRDDVSVILSDIEGTETLFEALLMAIPSAEWRAASRVREQ